MVLPQGLDGVAGQSVDSGMVLCQPELQPFGIAGWKKGKAPTEAREVPLPARIDTKHYEVRIDPASGALTSLKLRAGGKEMLAGPANVIVAEKPKSQKGDPGDHMLPRPQRDRLGSSNDPGQTIKVRQGPLATVVEVEGPFIGGGVCRRTMTFYNDYPRIDFRTELNDLPNLTVVVAEFPLAGEVT